MDQSRGFAIQPAQRGRPIVSGNPFIRLKFCTATPAAPLIRLSVTEITISRPCVTAGRHVAVIRVGDVLRRGKMIDDAHERLAL